MFKKTITALLALAIIGSATAQNEPHHREQNFSFERSISTRVESSQNYLSKLSNAEFEFTTNESTTDNDHFNLETIENKFGISILTLATICWSVICLTPIITVLIIHFRFQARNRRWQNSSLTKTSIF